MRLGLLASLLVGVLWSQGVGVRMRLGAGVGNPPVFSPALITSYATGTDNTFLGSTNAGLTAPSLIVYPRLPFIGGAHNCAVLVVVASSSYTFSTPTDDKSETWVAGPTQTDATDGEKIAMWTVLGDTAGTSKITIATSGTPANFIGTYLSAWLDEYQNCGTTLGGSGTLDTAATASALTLTLSAAPISGDLALGFFLPVNNSQYTFSLASITTGSGFTPVSKQLSYGKINESSTTLTTTSMQVQYPNGTGTILGVGIVIKRGATGNGPPVTKYIDHYQVEAPANATSQTFDFPCSGNLVVGLQNNGQGIAISSASGGGGTWVASIAQNNSGLESQLIYNLGATCATSLTIATTWGSAPTLASTDLDLISVTNATPSFDKSAVTTGNQTTAVNLTTVSLTPAATNEIVFSESAITQHTLFTMVADTNSHTPQVLFAVNTKDDDAVGCSAFNTSNSTLNQDNGYAFFQNTSNTTTITFIYGGTQVTGTGSCTTNPTGVGPWSAVAAAFQ